MRCNGCVVTDAFERMRCNGCVRNFFLGGREAWEAGPPGREAWASSEPCLVDPTKNRFFLEGVEASPSSKNCFFGKIGHFLGGV